MNLHAKMPFDPFNLMKNVIFPSFDRYTKVNDPYHPYPMTPNWLQGFQGVQQQFMQGWWDYLTWQQWSLQQAFYDNSRWLTHLMQLTQQPQTLYRYTRMNWQKPYLSLHAQSVTGTRLLTQLWTDTFKAWQQIIPGMQLLQNDHFGVNPVPVRKAKHEMAKHHFK